MSMFDNKFSFEDALKCDQMIHHLATYEVSGGMIFMPKNIQELMDFQKKVAEKFNYFKHLVQSGEISLVELSDSVADRNGPFCNKKRNMTDDELNEELMNMPEDKVIPTDEFFNLIGKMFEGSEDKKGGNLKIIPLPPEFAGRGGIRKLLEEGKIAEKEDVGENNEEDKNDKPDAAKNTPKNNVSKNKRTRGKNKG
jgi:hypothetical protein